MPPHPTKQKLYCYVDETGQDTEGQFFLVSLVITGPERDALIGELEGIEQATAKGLSKWRKAPFARRMEYIKAVLSRAQFQGTIFFSRYAEAKPYVELTVYTTAKAINQRTRGDYDATIIVDGLRDTEVRHFTQQLRKLNISVRKVRGVKDESNALIRLADAVAGFLRDALEGQAYAQPLYQEAISKEIITEV